MRRRTARMAVARGDAGFAVRGYAIMKRGYLFIALATLFFSTMEIALKEVAGLFNPVQLNLTRFLIGGLVLIPFARRMLRKRGVRIDGLSLIKLAGLGFLGIVVSMTLYQLAVENTNASVVAVLFSCNPVFVTFLAFLFLGEAIRGRHIAALVLEVLGTVAIINPFETRLDPFGVVLALAATILFAIYGVMGKKKVAQFGGSVVTCFGFLFGSLIILVFIGLTHIPAAAQAITAAGLPAFANIPLFAGYTLENLPVVLYVSAGVAGVGFCAYFMAMEYQPASIVSLVYFFKPALSPVLAWALHGEEIPLNMLLGIILIVAGSFCAIVPGVIETKRGLVFSRF